MNELNIEHAYEILVSKLTGWWELAVNMLPNLVTAALVMLMFVLVARLIRTLVSKLTARVSNNIALNRLFATLVFIAIVSIGLFTALSILKLDKAVTSLLTGAGIIGLALGFAFQDSAANFMAGIFMATRKPFKMGDIIETGDVMGKVVKMNLRNTVIHSFQGQEIFIPNKDLLQSVLRNYTSLGKRRVDLEVGVSYGDDLEQAKSVTIHAIENLPGTDSNKPVKLFYTGFGDSSINFSIRFWVDFNKQPDFLEARSKAIMAIKQAFDNNNITIPFPIRTLDFGIKGGQSLAHMLPAKSMELSGNENY